MTERHPDDVIWDQDFYEDILDNAHNVRARPCMFPFMHRVNM